MAIDKAKLTLELGEGGELTQVGEWAVSGRSATIKVRGAKAGSGTFTVKYDGKGDKSGSITVVATPTPGDLTSASPTVETGDKVKLTQAFNVAPDLGDVTFEYPEGVEEVPESKKIEGQNVTVEVTVKTAGEKIIKSKYKGADEKSVTITGTDPVMSSATASPDSISEGEESAITVAFEE